MTEKIAKPEIIIHSKFHGSIQGVNFSRQQEFASISWFIDQFLDDKNPIKRKMLLETDFIEELSNVFDKDYFKYNYEDSEIEQGLYDLFSQPISEMEVDYSRTLSANSQENFIETIRELYVKLGGKI